MMENPTDSDVLKQQIKELEARVKLKDDALTKQYKVEEVLIAAGFLTREKIREAEDIIESL